LSFTESTTENFNLAKMSKINNNSFFYIFFLLFTSIIVLLLANISTPKFLVFAQSNDISLIPQVYDENLKVELVSKEFKFPTTFAFIGPNDFLILEKNTGEVKRVVNDKVLEKPLVKLDVSTNDERGLLGVAIIKKEDAKINTTTAINNENITHYVFLYDVECDKGDPHCKNRIYRYELDNENNRLINPKLLLGIPSFPENSHIGGIIKIGLDGNLYLTVGNFQRTNPTTIYKSKTQNFEDGHDFDGRGGIISITQDGLVTGNSVIGDEFPFSLYYAYGIRNSFGINFDPVTGKLWDTENGPYFGDEVNIVEPGFNSGADKIFGIWKNDGVGKRVLNDSKIQQFETVTSDKPSDLLYIGDAYYDKPKFTWDKTVAPTAIVFPNSTKLGNQYDNKVFVASVDGGRIFNFELNKDRDGFVLNGVLSDKIANNKNEYNDILFADGFSFITDMAIEPDTGYLYLVSGTKVSKTEKFAEVYRIVPRGELDVRPSDSPGVAALKMLMKMAPKPVDESAIDSNQIEVVNQTAIDSNQIEVVNQTAIDSNQIEVVNQTDNESPGVTALKMLMKMAPKPVERQ